MNLQTYLMIKSAYYNGMEKNATSMEQRMRSDQKKKDMKALNRAAKKGVRGPATEEAIKRQPTRAATLGVVPVDNTASAANTIPASLITSEYISSPMYTDSINVDGNGPVRDDEVLQILDTTPQTLAAYRKAILADQRGQGMSLGSVAGGALGGVGGYYGTKWLNKKLGLTKDRGGWRKWTGRGLNILGTLGGAAGGFYLGGKAGHGITRSLQNKAIANHGGDSAIVADAMMANANKIYDKYNI